MFEENCRKCRQQFVHIINLESYGNYRMCPSLYDVLQTNFKKDGSRIYCCPLNQEAKVHAKIKPGRCVYCNQKMVKMAQVVGMKHFEVCPSAFGMFLVAYQTEQRGITTKIYCEPKKNVEAKVTKRSGKGPT